MAIVRTIQTSITAKTTNFVRGMGKARTSSKKFNTTLSKGAKVAKGFALAAVAAGSALAAFASRSVVLGDRLDKSAKRLGDNTDNLQKLHFIATQSGISINTMEMALQRMSRRLGEAARGTGEAKEALRILGVDAQKLVRLPLSEQFGIIARKLALVEDHSQKLSLTMKVVDSEGVKVIQTFADGVENLDKLEQKFLDLNIMTQNTVGEMANLSDAFDFVKTSTANFLANQFASILKWGRAWKEAFDQFPLGDRKTVEHQIEERFGGFSPGGSDNRNLEGASKLFLEQRITRLKKEKMLLADKEAIANRILMVEKKAREAADAAAKKLAEPKPIEDRNARRVVFFNDEDEVEEVSQITREFEGVFNNSFNNMTNGVESVTEAVKNLGLELVRLAARKAFIEPLAQQLAAGATQIFNATLGGGSASASQTASNGNKFFGRGPG